MAKETPSLNVNISTASAVMVATAASAIVAIAATSFDEESLVQDAIDEYFPAGQLTLVTNYREALANCGDGGTLKNVLTDLAQISAPKLIVVRVASSAADPATDTEIADALGALALCQQTFGFTPDYLGAPGLEGTTVNNKLESLEPILDAVPYVCAVAETKANAMTFTNGLTGSGKSKVLWPDFAGYKGRMAAIALGLRAKITAEDTQLMGNHKTLGNVPIANVTGLTIPVSFDLSGKTGDAKALNEAGITTAVNFDGAWRFWGDQLRDGTFESSHLIALSLKKEILAQEAKFASFPMNKGLIKNIIANAEAIARKYQSKGKIIGFEIIFDETANDANSLAAGAWQIDIDYTDTRPASKGVVNLRQTTRFYSTFAKALSA